MSMPSIVINFINKAQNIRQRSTRGAVCLVLKDATAGDKITRLRYASEIDTTKFTSANVKLIKLAFLGNPKEVYIVKYTTSQSFSDVEDELSAIPFDWICCPSVQGDQALCKTWLQGFNDGNPNHTRKAVLFNTTADDMHIVNFNQSAIEFKDTETWSGVTPLGYVCRIAGLLAGLPLDVSATYRIMDELTQVTEPADKDTALENGQFFFFNDDGVVRVARAINSLTTLGTDKTEAMKKITIVEVMDLIRADISTEFKNNFVGKYKNSASNQSLFIASINQYFDELANEGILNRDLENVAYVDVETQKQALIDRGQPAQDWDDETIKKHTVGSNVYVAGSVAVLDAIEDLQFNIFVE